MKFKFAIKLAMLACIGIVASGQAHACQCGASFHGKNSWEQATAEANWADVIFEGTPERFEFEWDVLKAKEGEMIPAGNPGAKPECGPRMLITFRVQRGYKGDSDPEVRIKTGLGGGDCGAVFAPGLTYLIFASRTKAGDLEVSMCSPGGWIGNHSVAPELRNLRKEHPIKTDLAPYVRLTPKDYAAQEGQRHRDFDEFQKQYASVTGKICGTVIEEKTKGGDMGMLSFLSTAGYSPFDHPTVAINADGSFCSGRLGPGSYFLYFTKWSDAGLASEAYYPGEIERSKAATVEIGAGRTQPNIVLKIPEQKTYSVRGIISTNDRSGLDARSVDVSLIRVDDGVLPAAYSQPIDFQSSYPIPKVKYFVFENVLPGRYIVYISVLGQVWYTKKEEVSVTTHMKFISLQLEHRK
jgi:hypothetical protein